LLAFFLKPADQIGGGFGIVFDHENPQTALSRMAL
jgi:hypothetical protein